MVIALDEPEEIQVKPIIQVVPILRILDDSVAVVDENAYLRRWDIAQLECSVVITVVDNPQALCAGQWLKSKDRLHILSNRALVSEQDACGISNLILLFKWIPVSIRAITYDHSLEGHRQPAVGEGSKLRD